MPVSGFLQLTSGDRHAAHLRAWGVTRLNEWYRAPQRSFNDRGVVLAHDAIYHRPLLGCRQSASQSGYISKLGLQHGRLRTVIAQGAFRPPKAAPLMPRFRPASRRAPSRRRSKGHRSAASSIIFAKSRHTAFGEKLEKRGLLKDPISDSTYSQWSLALTPPFTHPLGNLISPSKRQLHILFLSRHSEWRPKGGRWKSETHLRTPPHRPQI